MIDLTGKTALVTGGSRGIGRGIVTRLATQGADVAFTYRGNETAAAEVVAVIEGLGRRGLAIQGDVRELATAETAVKAAIEAFGKIDVLVNNAGIGDRIPAEHETMEHYRQVMEVNSNALFLLSQLAGRHMIERRSGVIVQVASILGLVASTPIKQASYVASKGAVVSLTRELGAQWARKGIRVNALAPGWFVSEMTEEMFGDETGRDFIARNCPMARGGEEHELDGALLFLASDASSYVTGQTLAVDGGWIAR